MLATRKVDKNPVRRSGGATREIVLAVFSFNGNARNSSFGRAPVCKQFFFSGTVSEHSGARP
jgi:hypothetical protein